MPPCRAGGALVPGGGYSPQGGLRTPSVPHGDCAPRHCGGLAMSWRDVLAAIPRPPSQYSQYPQNCLLMGGFEDCENIEDGVSENNMLSNRIADCARRCAGPPRGTACAASSRTPKRRLTAKSSILSRVRFRFPPMLYRIPTATVNLPCVRAIALVDEKVRQPQPS